MKWQLFLERHGVQGLQQGVDYDPFALLAQQAQAPAANVHVSVGSNLEYGAVKCTVSVTLSCPQNEKCIEMAGELAFRKAVELHNSGAEAMDIPLLPTVTDD
jgi:hypothetical protein